MIRVIVSNEKEHFVAEPDLGNWIQHIKDYQPEEVFIVYQTQLDLLRLYHVLGDIHLEALIFEEGVYVFDDFGNLDNWPRNLFSKRTDAVRQLIKEQIKIKKKMYNNENT